MNRDAAIIVRRGNWSNGANLSTVSHHRQTQMISSRYTSSMRAEGNSKIRETETKSDNFIMKLGGIQI
jgi:hypothetical protein